MYRLSDRPDLQNPSTLGEICDIAEGDQLICYQARLSGFLIRTGYFPVYGNTQERLSMLSPLQKNISSRIYDIVPRFPKVVADLVSEYFEDVTIPRACSPISIADSRTMSEIAEFYIKDTAVSKSIRHCLTSEQFDPAIKLLIIRTLRLMVVNPSSSPTCEQLTGTNLTGTNLTRANLTGANLTGAIPKKCIQKDTIVEGATMTGEKGDRCLIL